MLIDPNEAKELRARAARTCPAKIPSRREQRIRRESLVAHAKGRTVVTTVRHQGCLATNYSNAVIVIVIMVQLFRIQHGEPAHISSETNQPK